METRTSYELCGSEAGWLDYEPTFTGLLFKKGHCTGVLFGKGDPFDIEDACRRNGCDLARIVTEQTGRTLREYARA